MSDGVAVFNVVFLFEEGGALHAKNEVSKFHIFVDDGILYGVCDDLL